MKSSIKTCLKNQRLGQANEAGEFKFGAKAFQVFLED